MTFLGLRFDLRNPAFAGVSFADRYAAALDMCAWADERGFAMVTLSEHHGADDGYLPSIFPFAAAVAARTTRVRINLSAVIAPFHDPIRLAEDAAVVDQLSQGRLSLVIANGYVPSEFAMFGQHMGERARRVEETVAVLRQAWSGAPFDHRGSLVRVTPTPFQRPGPPILLGGSSAAAARRAARIADGFVPSVESAWAPYREACVELGRADPGASRPIPPLSLHVTYDVDATWDAVGPFALYEMQAYGRWAAASPAATGYVAVDDVEAVRATGQHMIVTPTECVEMAQRTGMLLFHPMMGGIPPAMAWSNLAAFEQEVLPHL